MHVCNEVKHLKQATNNLNISNQAYLVLRQISIFFLIMQKKYEGKIHFFFQENDLNYFLILSFETNTMICN